MRTRGPGEEEGTAAADPFSFSPEPTLEDLYCLHAEFAPEQNWGQFHQTQSLLLALVRELGSSQIPFRGSLIKSLAPKPGPPELSDVLIHLIALVAHRHAFQDGHQWRALSFGIQTCPMRPPPKTKSRAADLVCEST